MLLHGVRMLPAGLNSTFAVQEGGQAASLAYSLIRVWWAASGPYECEACEPLVTAVMSTSGRQLVSAAVETLDMCRGRLPADEFDGWLRRIAERYPEVRAGPR